MIKLGTRVNDNIEISGIPAQDPPWSVHYY